MMIPAAMLLSILAASEPAKSLEAEARAIFTQRCVSCHGAEKQRGGLRLDRKTDALRGGDSGAIIQSGKAEKSLLLKKVQSRDSAEQMPPTGERLSPQQVETLQKWINAGASWNEESAASETVHWAFQPVKRPTLKVNGSAAIDALIREKLQSAGLQPNPTADRRTLIRRLKFDLLGLPPTPEEVDAFVQDRSTDAYSRLVERYLASPQFGERWARHWLDVVRFAESNGFEMNQPRANAWHYRDWVIRSFNEDKPYDRFVQEQLAGDQLGADAATGFLVAGPWDQVKSPDPVLTANQRADELHDIVSTTGSAFLGLTVGCARCHAHKFDPISQVDYYRIKAVFAGVQHGERAMKRDNALEIAKQRDEALKQIQLVENQLAQFDPLANPNAKVAYREPVNAKLNRERFKPISAKYVRFEILNTNGSEPCIDELEIFSAGESPRNVALASNWAKVTSTGNYPGAPTIHRLEFINDGKFGNSRSWISNQNGRGQVTVELANVTQIDRIAWARDREGRYQDRLAINYRIEASTDGKTWQTVAGSNDRRTGTSASIGEPSGLTDGQLTEWRKLQKQLRTARQELAKYETETRLYAGVFTSPEPTHRLHRGDPMSRRELIAPGPLSEIEPKFEIPEKSSEAQRRLALAKWITSPNNPLTARVIVNRLWQQHFGTGLVDTPSDLGRNGAKPTHPELLDWLSVELMQPNGAKPWSLKHIHRLIVMSETYQQASATHESGLAKDAQSRLLWRYPPRRLDAEALRDSILAVTGNLELRGGGPGFDLFEPNGNYVRVFTPKKQFTAAEYRRMVYQTKPRMQLDDTFGAFDCPDGGQIAPKRNSSITALQALNLLNAPFLIQQSTALAKRIGPEGTPNEQVHRAFQFTFQRRPTDTELSAAVKLLSSHGLPALCRALLNSNEFLFID
jgi:mono/diheme cytochrome c family protein